MYDITLDDFTGPMDLLLSLIKQHKMDIMHIKLEIIIDEYLDYIKKMIPNISADIVEKQKSLQPGTCMAFGKAFKVPMIIKMPLPNPEPHSSNVDVVKIWQGK